MFTDTGPTPSKSTISNGMFTTIAFFSPLFLYVKFKVLLFVNSAEVLGLV